MKVPNTAQSKGATAPDTLVCAHCGYRFPANSIYAATWRGRVYCCDGCLLEAFRNESDIACCSMDAPTFTRLPLAFV